MANAITEKSSVVFNYIRDNADVNMTTADIAEALGLEKKSVEGTVTSGLQKKGLVERVPAKIELEDGTSKDVKFIKLTEKGANYDHAAAVAQDEAERAAKAAAKAE